MRGSYGDGPERDKRTRRHQQQPGVAGGWPPRVEGGFDIEGWRVALRDASGMLRHVQIHVHVQTEMQLAQRAATRPDDSPRTVWHGYESWYESTNSIRHLIYFAILSDTKSIKASSNAFSVNFAIIQKRDIVKVLTYFFKDKLFIGTFD